MSGVVKSVSKVFGKAGGLLGLGGNTINIEQESAQDTAQQEADKSQQQMNLVTARKKNKSLLSTGAGDNSTAKKLLGE